MIIRPGRLLTSRVGTNAVKKLLSLVGLGYLSPNVTYMLYPNDPSRTDGNRHYFYKRGVGWLDMLGQSFADATGTRIEMYDTSGANALPLLLLYFDVTLSAAEITTLTGAAFKASIAASYSLDVANVAAVSITSPDYANMIGWWDAAWATTLINNDPVTNWYDKGYLNSTLVQTGAASLKPTHVTNSINGRPSRSFDGGDKIINDALASYVTGEDKTVSCVACVKFPNADAESYIVSFGDSDSGVILPVAVAVTADKAYLYRRDSSGSGYTSKLSCAYKNGVRIFANVFGAQVANGWMNNAQFGNGVSQNFGLITLSNFTVGAYRYGAGLTAGSFTGNVAEIMLWKSALSDADRQAAQTYLAAKWGVTLS